MDIQITREGNTLYVKPDEEIHFDNYKEVEIKILEEIGNGAKDVVLDLTNVTTLYSMTLGMFNKIAASVSEKGGRFALTNINNEIRKVLKATRLDKIISIR
ncbi:MAG TPA: STAS domain-containing protein [bacterium]|nr:STAS domain-containing protein [bacterium]